jgi:hypothetical protein
MRNASTHVSRLVPIFGALLLLTACGSGGGGALSSDQGAAEPKATDVMSGDWDAVFVSKLGAVSAGTAKLTQTGSVVTGTITVVSVSTPCVSAYCFSAGKLEGTLAGGTLSGTIKSGSIAIAFTLNGAGGVEMEGSYGDEEDVAFSGTFSLER